MFGSDYNVRTIGTLIIYLSLATDLVQFENLAASDYERLDDLRNKLEECLFVVTDKKNELEPFRAEILAGTEE
jgi:hypothetical protein